VVRCVAENDQTSTVRQRDRRVFRSGVDLQTAIKRFLEDYNAQCKPFRWVADPTKSSPQSDAGTECWITRDRSPRCPAPACGKG
jgi:hypothetical protein